MGNIEDTINRLIEKSNVTIISSIDDDGFPNTKAMLKFRERDNFKSFYFSTNTSSMRVGQYIKNPKACIYFYDDRFFRGVMLKGTMEVLDDINSKEKTWQTGDELYYPLGVTDPDYCVLKFTAISGRYYSDFKSKNVDI